MSSKCILHKNTESESEEEVVSGVSEQNETNKEKSDLESESEGEVVSGDTKEKTWMPLTITRHTYKGKGADRQLFFSVKWDGIDPKTGKNWGVTSEPASEWQACNKGMIDTYVAKLRSQGKDSMCDMIMTYLKPSGGTKTVQFIMLTSSHIHDN